MLLGCYCLSDKLTALFELSHARRYSPISFKIRISMGGSVATSLQFLRQKRTQIILLQLTDTLSSVVTSIITTNMHKTLESTNNSIGAANIQMIDNHTISKHSDDWQPYFPVHPTLLETHVLHPYKLLYLAFPIFKYFYLAFLCIQKVNPFAMSFLLTCFIFHTLKPIFVNTAFGEIYFTCFSLLH